MDIFTAISICTGYDGIGLGLKQVIPNTRTICYVEREAYAICNLVAKIKNNQLDDAPIWDDLATFDGRPFKGLVDVFHGGIPCQPWSTAGKQKGIEDERWIWTDVFRIILEVRPVYVLLEEVPGFVRGGGLGYVLSDLAKAGYDAEWDCFTAAEVGATHKRERLFILAYSEQQRLRGQIQATRPSELGNNNSQRQYQQPIPIWQGQKENIQTHGTNSKHRYPARPGCEQYEWEEPYTILRPADYKFLKGYVEKYQTRLTKKQIKDLAYAEYIYETEPKMGRKSYGSESWVDEIRMCGNGVVPDVAALAWMILTKRLGVK